MYAQSVHRIPGTGDTVTSYIINIGGVLFPIVGIVVSPITSSGKQGGGLVLCPAAYYRGLPGSFPIPHVEKPTNSHTLVTPGVGSRAVTLH